MKYDNTDIDIKLLILDEINKRNVNSSALIDEKRKMYYNINCTNNIIITLTLGNSVSSEI